MALATLSGPLIYAWVGRTEPNLMGSVVIVQILAFSVTMRVGNATASVILKGAGEHKMLAWTNIMTGVVNVVLSMLLVRRYGLAGIAAGTVGKSIWVYTAHADVATLASVNQMNGMYQRWTKSSEFIVEAS